LLSSLKGAHFRAQLKRLPGYDATQLGKREPIERALSWLSKA
jgi:hypothetical protein